MSRCVAHSSMEGSPVRGQAPRTYGWPGASGQLQNIPGLHRMWVLWRGISVQRINQLSGYVFLPRINIIIAYYCDLGVSKNEVHPKVAALRGKHNDHLLKFWARHFQTDIDKRPINDIKSCSAVWWPLAMDGLVHISLLNGIVCG